MLDWCLRARPRALLTPSPSASTPPLAKIRLGSPAPTLGAGTATGTKTTYAGAQLAMQVDRVTQILSRLSFPRTYGSLGESHPGLRGISRPQGALRFPWDLPANAGAADLTQTETINECS